MADAAQIDALIQRRLATLGMAEVAAVEAAQWLDSAGLLDDSPDRPGLPLRKLLRAGQIAHAKQEPNNRWFIVGASPASNALYDPPLAEPPAPRSAAASSFGDVTSVAVSSYDRVGLQAAGFAGFKRFKGIDLAEVPPGQGVYVVLRERDDRPTFAERSSAGWFKGQDPTVSQKELDSAWPDGAHCVYIGKASLGTAGRRGLRKRIEEFRRFGDGEAIGHSGGRRIWQLTDADDFVLAWIETPTADPEDIEAGLLQGFVAEYGRLPIGNRTAGRRRT